MEVDEADKSSEPLTCGGPSSWFEFVLDETLLERHVNKPDAEPSPGDLIVLFLSQAEVASNIAKEINGKENIAVNGEGPNANTDNKKVQLLRLLAIKTACLLKWNLSSFENILPVSVVRSLLVEFLKVVEVETETLTKPLNWNELAPTAVFSILLYHRWVVLAVVRNCFPKKTSKVATSIQAPGLVDPNLTSAAAKDAVLRMVSENISASIDALESFIRNGAIDATMPTAGCIGSAGNEEDEILHKWNNGIVIDKAEMTCQVSFELGCIYFHQQNFEKADQMFQKCKDSLAKISSTVFIDLDHRHLEGYLSACASVLGRLPVDSGVTTTSLYQRVIASVRNNFQGLTALLIEDIQKQELSWTFRATLEESTQLAKRIDSLYEEVLVCNTIRRSLDGLVAVFDLVKTLNRTVGLVDFFIQVCLDVYTSINAVQRENLKLLLRNLCHSVSSSTHFPQKLLSCNLSNLFSESEREDIVGRVNVKKPTAPLETVFSYPSPAEEYMRLAEIEQELLVSYDPTVIKDLVQKIAPKAGNQTVALSDLWMLPTDLYNLIYSLPAQNPMQWTCAHILMAKARIAVHLQQYDTARNLLSATNSCVKDLSYKLSKLILWEILRIDLMQTNDGDTWSGAGASSAPIQELANRARLCVSSVRLDNKAADTLQPSPELLCHCIAFLLNLKDWDYLSSLVVNPRFPGFVQFGHLIGTLCKEVPQLRTARASANKFIDTVSLTFIETTRRTNSVAPLIAQRDLNAAVLQQDLLVVFITKIKEPMVLSLFVSCLTKLFNFVCIDVTEEIFSDYITIWPTSLQVQLNSSAVTEVVAALMDHVLSVNPRHPSWLRTQADLHFAQGNYWLSMRYYLELGIVTTDFFSEPVTKNVYNEQVYRRMIRCCSQLGAHTQVAVLCQFLDEVDYTRAFQALQEKASSDAMDSYYNCIWDVTILEYLINMHTKKGELDKRQYVMKLIGQMELNASNREDVLNEAARVRKSRFLRILSKQFLESGRPLAVAT